MSHGVGTAIKLGTIGQDKKIYNQLGNPICTWMRYQYNAEIQGRAQEKLASNDNRCAGNSRCAISVGKMKEEKSMSQSESEEDNQSMEQDHNDLCAY